MGSLYDTFVFCISIDANLQLTTVAGTSLGEVNDKTIFTVRKVVVGRTSVVSHPDDAHQHKRTDTNYDKSAERI